MASEANLGILLTATDSASPTLKTFRDTLDSNRMAIRELAMGVSYLGMSFASMGIMLKSTNSEVGKSVGNTLLMAGAIMTAIGTSVQFISAISKVIDSLKKLAEAEIIVKAFQGPAGWAMLGIGIAATAGTIAGVNAIQRNENKAQKVTIHNQVMLDGRQVGSAVSREIILNNQRTAGAGMLP